MPLAHAKPPVSLAPLRSAEAQGEISRKVQAGRTRQVLALIRLSLIFALFCLLVLALGLQIRTNKEKGWGLDRPLPPADAPAVQIPFVGVNVTLEQSNTLERRDALERLRNDGFGWVRQRFDWGQFEPQPGQYRWQMSDAVLNDITGAGLVPLVVLDGSPAWARASQDVGVQNNPFAPPDDPTLFARFATAFATRYHNQVRFYQIWDEPNIAPHWGNRLIEPVAYAQLLKAAAIAIRASDPDAVIITAALAPTGDRGHTAIDEVYFLQRLYAAGAAPYFDAVAVQPFGFGYTPDDRREQIQILNFQRIKLVRRALIAAGDGATPIWAVRYGWNTYPASPWGAVTPADQAVFAVRALEIAHREWPWLAALGWAIDQPAAAQDDPVWGFALTPPVEDGIGDWVSGNSKTQTQSPIPNPQSEFNILIILVFCPFLFWRGYTAARLLPWSHWLHIYRSWPLYVHVLAWALIGLFYYITTWPPLVILCWLLGAILVAALPQAGLWVAVIVLPFYFQHKELHLIDTTWVIAPAYAALLCLLPTLIMRALPFIHSLRFPSFAALRLCVRPHPNSPQIGEGVLAGLTRLQFPAQSSPGWGGVMLAWLIISLLASGNVWHWPAYAHGLLELVIAPLLLYLAVRMMVTHLAQQQRVMAALFAGGGLVAVIGLVGWWRGGGTAVDGVLRLVGPYFSPNHTALYLERTLFIGLGFTFATQTSQRHWWLTMTGIVAVALLLTASRGAWLLGIPAGGGVFVWLAYHRTAGQRIDDTAPRQPIRPALWVIASLGLTLLVVMSTPFLWNRIANSATVANRWLIWQTTLQLWQDYPIFGVGPGGFFWRYPAYLTQASSEPNILHPHNVWLEVGALWGIAGLLWLGLLLVMVIRRAQHLLQETNESNFWLSAALVAGLAAGFAHAQVDAFTTLADLAAWNWVALGLLEGIKKSR